ncbi:MAG: glycoside-pentoside-hexuronide (GPH):cation symporter [Bacilli bacterium]|nr:glycoside-pentoside-hexuronide (GPH):cation symporter [Bacilli bacterium]MDD3422315.1 glycoside-pentoside-hexuronide (GPH):cation symporter [Bacilli bacterium]MDD4065799.1 glycoside-pentoside-hexuronide (GPH):cation symporter [Bacilli bacterium]
MKKKEQTGSISKRTMNTFGWGCIGRDMCYNLVNSCFLIFLTDAIGFTAVGLAAFGVIMTCARIWDAVNDPMMGTIIDNTHSKLGKFKPWILAGALSNAVVVILMFMNYRTEPNIQVLIYGVLYILWGMTYTMNDISYWSMLPSLTIDPVERSKVGTITNIGASIGQFAVVAGATPIVNMISNSIASGGVITQRGDTLARAYFIIAIVISLIFVGCSIMTFFGVENKHNVIIDAGQKKKTGLKDMFRIIKSNDQLLVVAITYIIFNIGYYVTISMGNYYFNFIFNDYGYGTKYMVFAIILAISTIATMAFYPIMSKKFTRKKLYTIGTIFTLIGYVGIFLVGTVLPTSMIIIGAFGAVLFFGSSTLSMLIIMMFADTVEYGQWKTGSRNESILYSIRPFSVKLASAVSGFVVTQTIALSGLIDISNKLAGLSQENLDIYHQNIATILATITQNQKMTLILVMTVAPIILILISYFFFMKKFNLDKDRYNQILVDLRKRETEPNK